MGARGRHRARRGEGRRADKGATYRAALSHGEFRAVFAAQVLSMVGDQMAKVAIAVLVYARTDSAALTALTFALTMLPWIVGGPLLAPLADRVPRGRLMVTCDLIRAALVGLLLVPGQHVWSLLMLVTAVALFEPPFSAARSSLVPALLEGETYLAGASLLQTSAQLAQVVGFGAGGVAVAALTPHGALGVDAITFLCSAAIVAAFVRPRGGTGVQLGGLPRDVRRAVTEVLGQPLLRSVTFALWVGAGLSIFAEGLAVVYAQRAGGGASAAGWLLAAMPLGIALGGALLPLARPATHRRWLLGLMVAHFIPMAATLLVPPVPVAFGLWLLTGACGTYGLLAGQIFYASVPDDRRGRAFAITGTGLYVVQGLGLALAGALAELATPATVIGGAALLGLVLSVSLALSWPTDADAVSANPDGDRDSRRLPPLPKQDEVEEKVPTP